MRKSYFYVLLVLAFSSLIFLAPEAHGQVATTGAILGVVTDPSGAVVPNATVTVVDVATHSTRITHTDSQGRFDIEGLGAAGTLYNVTVQNAGFKTFVSHDVKLNPGERVTVNVSLQIGAAQSQVTVTASSVHVDTSSSASAGTISGTEVQDLQLNGRDFRGLALLVPGVNSTSSGGTAVGGGSLSGGGLTGETPISVNGLGREMNLYLTDGAYNVNTGNYINLNVVQPIDSIAEFRILKDNYSAKYGIAGGAVVMVATKSGTRQFHGSAYDFLRNNAFDARNFFSDSTPVLKQNIFGGSLGGPLYIPGHYNTDKTKTFFFASVEARVRHVGAVARGAMIPQDMRNGDFTNSPTLAAGGLTLDSTAQSILSAEHPGVNCVPDAHHLNPACFDPNAVTLMNKFWPLPNDIRGTQFLNYLNSSTEVFDAQDHTYRIDQNFGEKYKLMARASYETTRDALPNNSNWGGNPAPTEKATIGTTGFNTLLEFTANINPTTINEVSWTFTDDKPRLLIANQFLKDISPALTVNMPFGFADPQGRSPDISLSQNWAPINNGGLPEYASDGEQIFSEDFTKVKGAHTIQAGTMYIFGIKRQDNFSTSEGSYSFSGVHSGDPVADFLLGLDSSFNQNNTRLRGYFRYHQSESYIQDDWRATRRLTLNLGIRAQYFSSDKMEGNGFSDFSPSAYNPANAPVVLPNGLLMTNASGQPVTSSGAVANLLNGVVFPHSYKPNSNVLCGANPCTGTAGVPNGIFTTPSMNWAPRVGFAWDVFGNGKTSLRGGYGIGYSRIPFAVYNNDLGNPPFQSGITLLNGSLTNPSLGSPGAISAQSIGTIGPPNAEYRPVMIQTWSLTLERQLAQHGVFSLAYVGTGARNVPGGMQWNFPLPVAAPSVNGCLAGQTVPSGGYQFDPCLNLGLVSSDYTRPYVGWDGINGAADSAAQFYGTSNYNSLQAGYQYRLGRSLTFTAAYTYGHALSDVRSGSIDSRNTGNGAQNPRDFEAEYGNPGFDRTHIFTSGYVYELPFLKNRNDFAGKALGDWTFSGITVIQSGFTFDPGLSIQAPGLASRPNCVGNVSGPKSLNEWFNTSAFTAPAFGFFGSCGTGMIRGPGEDTWNWALYKTFPIGERFRMQFRAEFFNVWNHANFVGVDTSYGSPGFGQVTSALDPRQIEFALRLDF